MKVYIWCIYGTRKITNNRIFYLKQLLSMQIANIHFSWPFPSLVHALETVCSSLLYTICCGTVVWSVHIFLYFNETGPSGWNCLLACGFSMNQWRVWFAGIHIKPHNSCGWVLELEPRSSCGRSKSNPSADRLRWCEYIYIIMCFVYF